MEADATLFVIGQEDSFLAPRFDSFVGVSFERDSVPAGSDYASLEYRWNNEAQREIDYAYLRNLYIPLLRIISRALNEIHELERDIRSWELAFGSWFGTALCVCFDRYQLVRGALDRVSGPVVLGVPEWQPGPAADSAEFVKLASRSDSWNRLLLALCGDFIRPESFGTAFLPSTSECQPAETTGVARNSFLRPRIARFPARAFRYALRTFVRICAYGPKKPKIITRSTYFLAEKELSLAWTLRKTVTFVRFRDPEVQPSQTNTLTRAKLKKELQKEESSFDDSFVRFFLAVFSEILPRSYVESFNEITYASVLANGTAEASITANGHWYDDPYKLWLAHSVSNGTKIILSEHGGSLRARDYLFGFEQRSSDIFVSGWPPSSTKEIQLPLSTFIGRKAAQNIGQGKNLLVITYPGDKWALRASSQPQSYRGLSTVLMCKEFLGRLPEKPKRAVSIKVLGAKSSWERLENEYEGLRNSGYEIRSDSLANSLEESKLVVCLYPQTTYTDAFLSGVPVILLFDEAVSGVNDQARSLLRSMEENHMFFSDSNEAAEFVASVWDNPEKWWNSEPVKTVRSAISEYAMLDQEKPLSLWAHFLAELFEKDGALRNEYSQ